MNDINKKLYMRLNRDMTERFNAENIYDTFKLGICFSDDYDETPDKLIVCLTVKGLEFTAIGLQLDEDAAEYVNNWFRSNCPNVDRVIRYEYNPVRVAYAVIKKV